MAYVVLGGLAAVLLVMAMLLARRYAVVVVDGSSMVPAFQNGDRVLARRSGRGGLTRGAVVIVRHPAAPGPGVPQAGRMPGGARRDGGPWLIKRVAALPGDPVPATVRGDGNGIVPPGQVVLLGDNEDESFDSRSWGSFPIVDVAGVVVRRLADPAGEKLSEPRKR